MANITGVDHVQLGMPPGAEPIAREFYAGVLGLTEVVKPAHLAARGGAWFACGSAQLHLSADDAFQAAKHAHPALTVDGFTSFVSALKARGVAVRVEQPVGARDRVSVFDPFGNRVELIGLRD